MPRTVQILPTQNLSEIGSNLNNLYQTLTCSVSCSTNIDLLSYHHPHKSTPNPLRLPVDRVITCIISNAFLKMLFHYDTACRIHIPSIMQRPITFSVLAEIRDPSGGIISMAEMESLRADTNNGQCNLISKFVYGSLILVFQ